MSDAVSFPRIHPLPEHVANQIAAGEVIERPASVVKELIENSIDAAANRIVIDIEKAGVGLIRVTDNGQGIHRDDLHLAMQPHATSKLSQFSDLNQIASMGFRGEAIPSIASVSRFSMISRQQHDDSGWQIDNDCDTKPAAHEQGTTVEVRDLFATTPARRKFLKTDRTESLHIHALIKAIALSHHHITFIVKQDGQPLFHYQAYQDNPIQRVQDICGRQFVENSLSLHENFDAMSLSGWLGLNAVARSQSDRQYFYVNNRLVQDKHVSHAIRLAYQEQLDIGRFPSFVLFLQIDPKQVDINVHPAKSEVRFANGRNVHDLIFTSLSNAFSRNEQGLFEHSEQQSMPENNESVVQESNTHYVSKPQSQALFYESEKQHTTEFIRLLDGAYVIAHLGQQPVLIDVARTRILFAKALLLEQQQTNSIVQRPILVPVTYHLNKALIGELDRLAEQIQQWGVELQQVSAEQILVRAIPSLLHSADIEVLVTDLLQSLISAEPAERISEILASHTNDSGLEMTHDEYRIFFKQWQDFDVNNELSSLPWRYLDAEALKRLMTQ